VGSITATFKEPLDKIETSKFELRKKVNQSPSFSKVETSIVGRLSLAENHKSISLKLSHELSANTEYESMVTIEMNEPVSNLERITWLWSFSTGDQCDLEKKVATIQKRIEENWGRKFLVGV
jgi:hypothetical protein